jgi:hypothetical protein
MKLIRLIEMSLNATYSKVLIPQHLSHTFPIQNDLKQRDALSPLFLNFTLEYANRRVQEKPERMKLNGSCQFLVFAGDINSFWDNMNAIHRNTEALTDGRKNSV